MRWRGVIDDNIALTVGSTVGLVLLNLAAFSVQTSIFAIALAGIVAIYLRGRRFGDVEIFIVVLAELSPISLNAGIPTAFAYQSLIVALLVALCVPLNHLNEGAWYNKVVLATGLSAVIPFALFVIMLYTRALQYSFNQLFAFSTVAFLGVVGMMLIVSEHGRSLIEGVGL